MGNGCRAGFSSWEGFAFALQGNDEGMRWDTVDIGAMLWMRKQRIERMWIIGRKRAQKGVKTTRQVSGLEVSKSRSLGWVSGLGLDWICL